MTKKSARMLAGIIFALVVVAPLHAQVGGCENSPENPTAILALVGVAGVFASQWRNRFKRHK